jgi:flagellar basal-body rod protein FlgC
MNLFDDMTILSSGLAAQRVRMTVTTSNMANAQTTRTTEGGPYQRRDPVFATASLEEGAFANELSEAMQRVDVPEVVQDKTAPRRVLNPTHPDADKDGYLSLPNINMVEEMVNMLSASRSYEAQVTAMHGLVEMAEKALGIGR